MLKALASYAARPEVNSPIGGGGGGGGDKNYSNSTTAIMHIT